MFELEFNHNKQEQKTLFADVILPLPLPRLYTYRIPFEYNEVIAVGARVVVEFGKSKILTAIVAKLHEKPPEEYQAKYILELLDDVPAVTTLQLELFNWIAEYYMCHVGEVVNIALPSGLKISSESKIQLFPGVEIDEIHLDLTEQILIQHLQDVETLSQKDIPAIVGKKNIYPIIKSLVAKEAIIVFQEVKEKYVPKRVKKVRLQKAFVSDTSLEKLFEELSNKPKQLNVLLRYLQKVPVLETPNSNTQGLPKALLLDEDTSNSSYNTLRKNNILEEFEILVNRFDDLPEVQSKEIAFSATQESARDQILEQFDQKDIVLLHGITGSGKTEIYIDLIQQAIDNGTQALYLLPEIALTTQIVSRLKKVFGDKMGVYHSKFSDNERVDIWKGVLTNKFSLIVGVRSSSLLPFQDLGLIIVDEEHDASYKQMDPAPRYNARDAAMIIGRLHKAKVLLGSATPSLETFYHAINGNYGFVQLLERFSHSTLPEIHTVKPHYAKGNSQSTFNQDMLAAIKTALENSEQAILFQNRRGYSPFIICDTCEEIPHCPNCSVSLTYHKYSNDLRCHYCGYIQGVPTNCPSCGSMKLRNVGLGTERIEDDLAVLFPDSAIQRMDSDTTRKKHSHQQIIDDFSAGRTDILVGTQMLSKGMDFKGVSIVGIVDTDRIMFFPDFRAHERAFQLLTQVSGRAGRREKKGHVFIQTNSPDHPIIDFVKKGNYYDFFKKEILEREQFKYPPFVRIIKITIKHISSETCDRAAHRLAKILTTKFSKNRVVGPNEPVISKIRNQFLMCVQLKIERKGVDIKKAKELIQEIVNHVKSQVDYKSCSFVIDVDPV